MSKEKIMLIVSSSFIYFYIFINILYDLYTKKIFQSTGYFITCIILYILLLLGASLFMFYSVSKKEKLEDHRGLIMLFSILFFIFNVVSGVLGFIVFKLTEKKDKRELPKIQILKGYNIAVYIILLVVCLAIVFFGGKITSNRYIVLSYYFIILSSCIFVFRKDLKRDFKYFKEYFREYNSFVLGTYLKSLGVLVIISLAIRLSTGIESATNQESIKLLFNYLPLFTLFLALIYAPISEELLFRGCFGKLLKNKWLFIIISGVSFGLLHVIDDFKSFGELLYVLVYSSLGCFLAYTYYKTKNICCSIYFHLIQNTFSVLVLILAKFLIN